MPPRRDLLATRRTALGGALAGVAVLAGCDLDRPETSPSGSPSPTGPGDPDETLVAEVRTELDQLIALIAAAVARRPVLVGDLADLADLHAAHLAVLPEGGDPAPAPPITGTPAAVHALVRRREEQARRRLADWSVAAESGSLARLLASMSAGLAQHLAAAPDQDAR